MRVNAETEAQLFRLAAQQLGPRSQCYMGFDVHILGTFAHALRVGPLPDDPEAHDALRFNSVRRPE